MKQSEFSYFGPFALKFTLILDILKERFTHEFDEYWLTEYEKIDHYLIPISSKFVRFFKIQTKLGSDNDRFRHVTPNSELNLSLSITYTSLNFKTNGPKEKKEENSRCFIFNFHNEFHFLNFSKIIQTLANYLLLPNEKKIEKIL